MQILGRGCAVAGLLLTYIPCAAQAPEAQKAAPKVVSAKRAKKYTHSVMVTEPKDKEKDVLTIVEVGGISLADFDEQRGKKGPSLLCGESDHHMVISTTGGTDKVIILQVFIGPKEGRKCTFAFGDHSLALEAEEAVQESISADEYLK